MVSEARSAVEGLDAYRVRLTRAANEVITERWGEQTTPLRAGSGYALQLAEAVRLAGVPLDFAIGTVRAMLERRPASEGPPRAMTYFREGILDAWGSANDPGRPSPSALPAMAPEELWRLVNLTGLHRVPFEQREAAIQEHVTRQVIPDEAAFREAWGMIHVDAHRIVTTSRDSAAIVSGFRALLARGEQQPMPKHMAGLPHPFHAGVAA